MNISTNTPVGEVVKLNFKTAQLFQANRIDYCCGGQKTISEACSAAGIKPEPLIEQLEQMAGQTDPDSLYIDNLQLDELSDYIIKRHHSYVRNTIPFLKQNLDKICDVHGDHHPELFEVRELFDGSAGALTVHMQKEELMLFPYIKKLAVAKREDALPGKSPFGTVSNPISAMLADHDNEGRRYERIAELTGDYSIPEDACTTYRVTLSQLQDFERDLHRHIHLENNILFPKAAELEAELVS